MSSDQQRTLQSELASRLESNPQGNALTFLDSRGRCEWRTFEEFYTASACWASVLHDRGLRAGDGCVLVMPSDEDACQVLLACLILGALPVLIAPPVVRGMHSNLNAVVRHVVGKISARMVVVGDEAVELGTELQKEQADLRTVISPDDFGDHGSVPAPIAAPAASDIGLYQLTSGTTGFPKVCLWRQHGVLASLDGMYAKMELSKDDIFLNWTPLYHDMGLINNFMLCMIHQIPLAMIETTEFLKRPGLWLRGLDVTKSTTTWSPNFGFAFMTQRVKDADIEGVRLDAVKGFWNAAERVHLDTMLAFQKRFEKFGVSLGAMKTNFGCAENVGGATFSDPNGNFVVEHVDPDRLFEDGVAEPIADESRTFEAISVVSVGQPCPGMTVDILSDAGEPLEDGRVGELALNTPSKMEGYVDNSEDTARALRDGRLCTGDMAYKRGDEVFWVGRVQERINVQGKKYDPSDFEKVLLEVAGLRKGCFAAFGIDDVKSGTQRLVIVSETSDKEKIPDTDIVAETKQQIAGQLGTGLNEMILLDPGTMSKTSSGKRRHRFYRQQYIEGKLTTLPNARAIQA